jgi:hypothetical protein
MNSYLQELSIILEKSRPFLYSCLQPGLSKESIDAFSSSVSVNLLPEAYELYNWRNGVLLDVLENESLGRMWIIHLGVFAPFEVSLDEHTQYVSSGYWDAKQFPLFGSGAGDYYLLDCDIQSHTFKMVLYFSPSAVDFETLIPIYDSLEHLIKTTIECYQSGIYIQDEHENLKVNYQKLYRIGQKINPRSKYWELYVSSS